MMTSSFSEKRKSPSSDSTCDFMLVTLHPASKLLFEEEKSEFLFLFASPNLLPFRLWSSFLITNIHSKIYSSRITFFPLLCQSFASSSLLYTSSDIRFELAGHIHSNLDVCPHSTFQTTYLPERSMSDSSYSRQSQHVIVLNGLHITAYYAILVILPFWNAHLNLNHVFYAVSFGAYYLGQLLGNVVLVKWFVAISTTNRSFKKIGKHTRILIAALGLFASMAVLSS